jgi:hypothetical protein
LGGGFEGVALGVDVGGREGTIRDGDVVGLKGGVVAITRWDIDSTLDRGRATTTYLEYRSSTIYCNVE